MLGAHHLHNLPTPLTSFVGREHELATVTRMLREYRLLTLTGTGGSGKTRLALQATADEMARFSDGIWFVELAALGAPDLVPGRIARELGITAEPGRSVVDTLCAALQAKELLLIVDNCEHLLAQCAELLTVLLARCPQLTVLATSREPLAVAGEAVLLVPPLSLPDAQTPADLDQLTHSDAGRLFIARAQAAAGTFRLTAQNAQAVKQICAQLDGLPLAIELAAACVRTLPVRQLADRLDHRFQLLTRGDRSAPPRQQTLKAVIDWSYQLLEEHECVAFRRLAVFAGGFSIEAAEAICVGDYPTSEGSTAIIQTEEVLNLLMRLVEKSLVTLEQSEGRYRLLETMRYYSREKLVEAQENDATSLRHFQWYLRFAEEAAAHIGGPQEREWLDTLEREHDNCRGALTWVVERGEVEEAACLALALWPFWHVRTYVAEAQRWFNKIATIELGRQVSEVIQARMHNARGVIAHTLGQFDQADLLHREAIRLWREVGDQAGLAAAVLEHGWQYFHQADLLDALECADDSLMLARQVGNQRTCAAALLLRAAATHRLQQFGTFETASSQSTSTYASAPLGSALQQDTSIADLKESLRIWREIGDERSAAAASTVLAMAELSIGDYDHAKSLLADAFSYHVQMRDLLSLGTSFAGLMQAAIHVENRSQGAIHAAQLLGAASTWSETLGGTPQAEALASYEPIVKPARDLLGNETFDQEVEFGKRLDRDKVVALVTAVTRSDPGTRQTPPQRGRYPNDLTEREVEVLRLVADGLSNPQIAHKLVLSTRTVEAHLRSIFAKLEVTSRTAAARVAVEHNLA